MTPAVPLLEAAREVQDIFSELHLAAIVIGGIAVLRWGEARATRDVDFTLLCPFGEERRAASALSGRLRGRIEKAAEFAATQRVFLATASNGIPIDIAFGGLPFEERAVRRGSDFEFLPGVKLKTCSAEDLVVMKAFAGRDRDLLDIPSILLRQGAKLDWKLIEEELKPLLEVKQDSAMWGRLVAMR